MRPAQCAFILTPPSSTNSVTIGRTAKIDDRPSELPTGSYSWWYIGLPSRWIPCTSYVFPRVNGYTLVSGGWVESLSGRPPGRPLALPASGRRGGRQKRSAHPGSGAEAPVLRRVVPLLV